MTKEEAIKKIKWMWEKEVIYCKTNEETNRIANLLGEAGLMTNTWYSYRECRIPIAPNFFFPNLWYIRNDVSLRDDHIVYEALDFLDSVDEEKKDSNDIINEGLDRLYWDEEINLQSSVNQIWETCTQIIHFSHGNKRTFSWIITSSIKQWEFTKMKLKDGRLLMINTENVDCVEVFTE